MRKLALPVLVVVLLLSLNVLPSGAASSVVGKKIALDPGHGGSEVGAAPYQCKYPSGVVYDVVYEKDINLAVAHVLKDVLIREGMTESDIVMTRSDDSNMSLSARVDVANAEAVDVLVSIHHNGSSNPDANWTETYYTQPDDKPLAVELHNALLVLGLQGKGAKHAPGFTLTRKPDMPSAITEAYFATARAEAENFCGIPEGNLDEMLSQYKDEPRVKDEAEALKHGLINYFDLNTGGGGKGKGGPKIR